MTASFRKRFDRKQRCAFFYERSSLQTPMKSMTDPVPGTIDGEILISRYHLDACSARILRHAELAFRRARPELH